MEEELSMEEITIEELEERLELVRDGWKALGERVRTLAEGRAKAMACYPKLKDSTMDLLAERAEKVSSRLPRNDASFPPRLFALTDSLLLDIVRSPFTASTPRTPILHTRLDPYSSNRSCPRKHQRRASLGRYLRPSNRL